MTSPLQKRKLMAEINVVPYIDVMLVLLIIFMIVAPKLISGVNVNLPKAKEITDRYNITIGGNIPLTTTATETPNPFIMR